MENANLQELHDKITAVSAFIQPLKIEIGRVIVGQDNLVDSLIAGFIANGHILVEGVPGLAKTLTVTTLALATGGECSRIQFTPDLLPADVVGTNIYNPKEATFSVKKGPVFANVVLADEINRAPAKVQSALLEAMQERQVTIGGTTYKLPEPFLVMATQNPLEQEGTYPLPEAQVDRFMMKLIVSYPSREEERMIMERMAHPSLDLKVMSVISLDKILEARIWADKVYIDPKIQEYILDIIFATRNEQRKQLSSRQSDAKLDDLSGFIQCGASPRATLSFASVAKTKAFMAGRAYVVPQDIKNVALEVLRHRIIPSYEAEAENLTSDDLINKILNELRTP